MRFELGHCGTLAHPSAGNSLRMHTYDVPHLAVAELELRSVSPANSAWRWHGNVP